VAAVLLVAFVVVELAAGADVRRAALPRATFTAAQIVAFTISAGFRAVPLT